MTLVVRKMVKPADLAGHQNGVVDTTIMRLVAFAGRGKFGHPAYGFLHHLCADAWEAMVAACQAETGYTLTATDWFRFLSSQEHAFAIRYIDHYDEALCGAAHKTKFLRSYQGKTWYLRRGMIPCAVPGTSPHGEGLATDGGVYVDIDGNGVAETINYFDARLHGAVKAWLLANVERFGFSWAYAEEGADDPHLQYFAGDNAPAAVLAHKQHQTTPTEDDDMATQELIQVAGDTAVYRRDGLFCTWVQTLHQIGVLKFCGHVPNVDPGIVTVDVLNTMVLIGDEPIYGSPPPNVTTSGADFARWDH